VRWHGQDNLETMSSATSFAGCLALQGKNDEALEIYQTCLAFHKRCAAGGLESTLTLVCATRMAFVLTDLQRFDEAEAVFSECVPITKRVLGPDHHVTLLAVNGHAKCIALAGRHANA
jgi:hypothetical protein